MSVPVASVEQETAPGLERLARLEELEQLEQRVATVAHELNNVFTVVRAYTYFARQGASNEQRARDLRVIAGAAERGTTLTDWLASSAEREPRAEDEVYAKEFLAAVAARLQLLALAGTNVEISGPLEDLAFRANRPRLKHVLVSLILSANQALSGGRFKFSIERRVVGPEPELPLEPGAYVALVIDCRPSAETPREVGAASVKEQLAAPVALLTDMVASMNGLLLFAPSSEEATRFELYLPLASGVPIARPTTKHTVVAVGGTILVVEDDAAIRFAMRRTLVKAGYSVLEASDGLSAKQILADIAQTVSMVVSDIVLPRGGGADLFAWIRASYPNIAVLLISGREREGEATASELGVDFLGKPFYPAELLAAVARTISVSAAAVRRLDPFIARPVVVIVDDDPDIRDSFERLLTECDFDTYVAKSGLHALQILSERRVDAVVADQYMPGLDGISLLELVFERFPECVRILCTGHPAADVVISAVNRGRVHRVLTKTMHAVALRDEIERSVLEAGQARQSRAESALSMGSKSDR